MATATDVTIRDLLRTALGHRHSYNCPGCEERISTARLVDCVYMFEPCGCDRWPYEHLVEQPWHRACFQKPVEPAQEVKD